MGNPETRETKEFVTPVGKNKIVAYSYLTGREKRAISDVFLRSTKFSMDENQKIKTDSVDATLTNKSRDRAISLIVVSVDGVKEDVVNKILDLRNEDYEFVVAEIDKITEPTDKKKLSDGKTNTGN